MAAGAVVHAAAPVRVKLKAMETLGAVLSFEELHCALIHHAPPRLLATKAFVEPIIDAVVKGIRVGTGNAVGFLPQGLAQRSRKRVVQAGLEAVRCACLSRHLRERPSWRVRLGSAVGLRLPRTAPHIGCVAQITSRCDMYSVLVLP